MGSVLQAPPPCRHLVMAIIHCLSGLEIHSSPIANDIHKLRTPFFWPLIPVKTPRPFSSRLSETLRTNTSPDTWFPTCAFLSRLSLCMVKKQCRKDGPSLRGATVRFSLASAGQDFPRVSGTMCYSRLRTAKPTREDEIASRDLPSSVVAVS